MKNSFVERELFSRPTLRITIKKIPRVPHDSSDKDVRIFLHHSSEHTNYWPKKFLGQLSHKKGEIRGKHDVLLDWHGVKLP